MKHIISRQKKSGFTLIELMIVATIIIVMTGLGIVSYSTTNRKARDGKRQADLAKVQSALELYRSVNGEYPESTTFSGMVDQLDNYLSNEEIEDPKNVTPYLYRYTSHGGGQGYVMRYRLESESADRIMLNP